MKGRRGMKDWARTAEDKLYIPKEVFTTPTEGKKSKADSHCQEVCLNFGLFGTDLYRSVCQSSHAPDKHKDQLYFCKTCRHYTGSKSWDCGYDISKGFSEEKNLELEKRKIRWL